MYKLTTREVVSLVGKKISDQANYHPIADINGDYFISEVEHKICGLGTLAEYVPPEQTNIDEIN